MANQVLTMQRNWIGKSEGLEFDFELDKESIKKLDGKISKFSVFTTRPDTIYGVTYTALAPEHKIIQELIKSGKLDKETTKAIEKMINMSERDRAMAKKEGYYLGIDAIHPLTQEKIPVWVANFVLASYGSGAVMSVPAHDERDFEFAKEYSLPIKRVIEGGDESSAYIGDGKLINSAEFARTPKPRGKKPKSIKLSCKKRV